MARTITALGEYVNKRGETVIIDAIDGNFHTDSCNNFYLSNGTCYFWAWKDSRFIKNTDPLSDLDLGSVGNEPKCKHCGK